MPKFLFWNLNKKDIHGFVANLAREEDVDVLILAECVTPAARLLEELNREDAGDPRSRAEAKQVEESRSLDSLRSLGMTKRGVDDGVERGARPTPIEGVERGTRQSSRPTSKQVEESRSLDSLRSLGMTKRVVDDGVERGTRGKNPRLENRETLRQAQGRLWGTREERESQRTHLSPTEGLKWGTQYQYAWGVSDHLVFFVRRGVCELRPLVESSRVSIRRLTSAGRLPMLVVAAHLPSKFNYSDDSQVFESVRLSRMIAEVEASEGHHRTILLGDLNMNPFEKGMVAASGGLHAVPSRRVAMRGERRLQRENYPYFYNPMWNYLGDRDEAGGTFYFEHGEPICYYWNMFDQVLLRPALLEGFGPEQVKIVTQVRGVPLLEGGRPDKEMASDHLPVTVELNC